MTPTDLRILRTALAFTAVMMEKSDSGPHDRAATAGAIARMIEEFCRVHVPHSLGAANDGIDDSESSAQIDEAIERFKVKLRVEGEARLPEERRMLLQFYDRLQQRKARRAQRLFYENAAESVIADLVLKMIDNEIQQDGDTA